MGSIAISIPFPGPYPSLSHPDISGITFSKEKGWDFHGAPGNMNFVIPMGSTGGDIYPCTIKLTNEHYEQQNTSLNKLIWGGLPVTKAELEAVERAVDDNLKLIRCVIFRNAVLTNTQSERGIQQPRACRSAAACY